MMSQIEMLPIDQAQAIYLVWGFALLGLVAMLARAHRALHRRCAALQCSADRMQGEIHSLQRVLREVHDTGNAARAREAELQQRLMQLSRQQEQLLLRDAETGSYFEAVREAQRGGNIDRLIRRSDVSRTEAELIMLLHGKAQVNAAER